MWHVVPGSLWFGYKLLYFWYFGLDEFDIVEDSVKTVTNNTKMEKYLSSFLTSDCLEEA